MRRLDADSGIRGEQVLVAMSDGTRLNTFCYLPAEGERFPVIVQRTPYGIGVEGEVGGTDPARGWLPDPARPMWGALMRGWRAITARGYGVVYQDCRGRHASEGIDRVYADDAGDGYDTLEWVSRQPWCNGRIGMCGSSAAATTTLAAASRGHPALKCFFAQVGGASIYNDVVCEGNAIEMERLWLWVAANIPGLSASHRAMVKERFQLDDAGLERVIAAATAQARRLEAAKSAELPFVGSPDWMRLPLLGFPEFSVVQPFLDEILSHPAPDAFRAAHDFKRTIAIPGFHATTWYDIFQTSVISAFQQIQARVGDQRLWIGPNAHYFIYENNFWPRDPFFEWFDHWLMGKDTPLLREPPVHFAPVAWVDAAAYRPTGWRVAATWPPDEAQQLRLTLAADGSLRGPAAGSAQGDGSAVPQGQRSLTCDPRAPIPTAGGRNMLIAAGPLDQRQVRAMAGYGLVYRGAPLQQGLTLSGPARVQLHVSSDAPDADIVVKLVEAHPDGRALLLMDGVCRLMLRDGAARPLQPGEVVTVSIGLGHLFHVVAAGSWLEVDVSGSCFPRRARNTNSGNVLLAADGDGDIRIATNTLHHDAAAPCYLELTVEPRHS